MEKTEQLKAWMVQRQCLEAGIFHVIPETEAKAMPQSELIIQAQVRAGYINDEAEAKVVAMLHGLEQEGILGKRLDRAIGESRWWCDPVMTVVGAVPHSGTW